MTDLYVKDLITGDVTIHRNEFMPVFTSDAKPFINEMWHQLENINFLLNAPGIRVFVAYDKVNDQPVVYQMYEINRGE